MNVYYCDAIEIQNVLASIKESPKGILKFMCSEENAIEDYIIKIYLLSLLENFEHIDNLKFAFEVISGKEFRNADEAFEIINSKNDKTFWNWLLQERNFGIKINDDIVRLIKRYFYVYYYYNFGESKLPYNELIPDDENMRNNQKTYITTLFRKELEALGISIEHFNMAINVAKKKAKIKYNSDETEIDFVSCVKLYVEKFLEKSKYIDILINDLIMNLMMLRCMCDSSLFEENDLSVILRKIRLFFKEKVKDSGYITDKYTLSFLYDEHYRENRIYADEKFWKNTSLPENIPDDMNELFLDFFKIQEITDDTEYAVKCYKLCQRFLQIHPYGNGNGRTSKYLLFLLLMRRGILPVPVTDNHSLTSCYEKFFDSAEYFLGRMHIIARRAGIR